MKRFPIKLAGFGLAALAGSAYAGDGEWRAAGQSSVPPAAVVPAGGVPGELPPSVRFGAAARPGADLDEPLWLPASPRPQPAPFATPTPAIVPVQAQVPAIVPVQYPEAVPARPLTARRFLRRATLASVTWPVMGPRVGSVPPQAVEERTSSVAADYAPAGAAAQAPASPPPRELPAPTGQPEQPPPMPRPGAPGGYLPSPKTQPPSDRPVTPPAVATPAPVECPVAPPELMVPAGEVTPGKHGTFGSAPMRLSRDFPSLSQLCETPLRGAAVHRGGAAAGDGVQRGFVQAEYLLWWARDFQIPILGTTNTQGGFGFIGEPGTAPIIGPGPFLGTFRQGFRARAGWALDDSGSCALDGSFFFLGRRTAEEVRTSETFPIITRPIFSPNPQGGIIIGQTGEAVTVPGILTGSLGVEAESVLWGFDANIRKCLFTKCDRRAGWFAGYRNVNLSEELTITENINVVGAGNGVLLNDPPGTVVVVKDRFATDNHFHGGQIGALYERRWGRVSLDARASVALGVTHQELDISGFQTRTRPGQPPVTFPGGLLAASSNLGSFTRNEFSVVPEVTLNAGYWVTPSFKVYVGYNFLFWSNVIRPGEQIDMVVDLTNVPNAPAVPPGAPNRPAPLFRQSDLWVTGVQFGAEWRW